MARLDRSRVGSKETDRVIRDRLDERMVVSGRTDRVVLLTFHAEDACAEVTTINDDTFLALRFAEFPDYELRTNATQEDALLTLVDAGHLPEDTDKWAGVAIPWAGRVNRNPKNKQPVTRIYPVDPELFENAMQQLKDEGAVEAPKGRRGRR